MEEPLARFIPRLALWDKIQTHNSKYLDLIDSLQSANRKNEKNKIELEVQKGNLNPEDTDIVAKIVSKLEEWFGKPRLEEGSEAWRILRDMKRKSNN